jgi:hypothetical protein
MERTRRVIRAMESAARSSDEPPRSVEGVNLEWLRLVETGKILKGKERRAMKTPNPVVDEVKELETELEYLKLHRTARDVRGIKWDETKAKRPDGVQLTPQIARQAAKNVSKRIARILSKAIPQAK